MGSQDGGMEVKTKRRPGRPRKKISILHRGYARETGVAVSDGSSERWNGLVKHSRSLSSGLMLLKFFAMKSIIMAPPLCG